MDTFTALKQFAAKCGALQTQLNSDFYRFSIRLEVSEHGLHIIAKFGSHLRPLREARGVIFWRVLEANNNPEAALEDKLSVLRKLVIHA